MRKNMNSTDKIIRLLGALVIAILIASGTLSGTVALVLGIVAVILVITAFLKFCPLYALFGLSTLNKRHETRS